MIQQEQQETKSNARLKLLILANVLFSLLICLSITLWHSPSKGDLLAAQHTLTSNITQAQAFNQSNFNSIQSTLNLIQSNTLKLQASINGTAGQLSSVVTQTNEAMKQQQTQINKATTDIQGLQTKTANTATNDQFTSLQTSVNAISTQLTSEQNTLTALQQQNNSLAARVTDLENNAVMGYTSGTSKLLGADDAAIVGACSGNYLILTRYQCVLSDPLSLIRVKSASSGSVKVALYSDSNGLPGSLLASNTADNSAPVGWGSIQIAQIGVAVGAYYWIAFDTSTDGVIGYSATSGGTTIVTPASYNGYAFPNSLQGVSFTSSSVYLLVAGWSQQ